MISKNVNASPIGHVRLPDLGRRGEGWVALQAVLVIGLIVAGFIGPLWTGPARAAGLIAGAVLVLSGVGLFAAGILRLRRQLTPFPKPVPGGRLIDDGAFAIVRHPMYGGAVIAALGWGIAMASPAGLAGALVLAIFFDLKSGREEAWLAEQFAGYAAYRRRTRKLIPCLY